MAGTGAETITASSYAGSRPQQPRPVISALANAAVEKSPVTDLDSAMRPGGFAPLITIAEQTSTFFLISPFGRALALCLFALWTRSVY
jgi:hypothetical protein